MENCVFPAVNSSNNFKRRYICKYLLLNSFKSCDTSSIINLLTDTFLNLDNQIDHLKSGRKVIEKYIYIFLSKIDQEK